jgi:hypothetical protein
VIDYRRPALRFDIDLLQPGDRPAAAISAEGRHLTVQTGSFPESTA